MKHLRLIWIGLALLIILRPVAPGFSAAPSILLELKPNSVDLPLNEPVEVLLLVKNESDATLSDLKLSWVKTTSVQIEPESLAADTVLLPDEVLPWPIMLTWTGGDLTTNTVYFRLGYVFTSEGEKAISKAGTSTADLTLQELVPEAVDITTIAELGVETAIADINEHRPGIAYLTVTNKSTRELQITDVRVRTPDFVTVDRPEMSEDQSVPPQGIRVFEMDVSVSDRAFPGKHLLFFEAEIAWQQQGLARTATLTASKEIEVNVLGENAILQLISVPSLLLLPGFLMVTMFQFLWTKASPKKEKFFENATAEFWMFSVLLSLITALVYPLITRIGGAERNILRGYGLVDIIQLWAGSLIAAAVIWLVIASALGISRRRREKELRARTPATHDDPLATLRKMVLRKAALYCEKITCDGKGWYALTEPVTGEPLWAAARIMIKWNDLVEANDADRLRVQAVLGQGNLSGDALSGLIDVLNTLRTQQIGPNGPAKLDIYYDDGNRQPAQLAGDKWTRDGTSESIIRQLL